MTEHLLTWRPPEFARRHASAPLTPREADVLTGIVLGLTNAQIGRRLHLSEDTVKSHAKTLYRALGVRNRCDAVTLAMTEPISVQGRGAA